MKSIYYPHVMEAPYVAVLSSLKTQHAGHISIRSIDGGAHQQAAGCQAHGIRRAARRDAQRLACRLKSRDCGLAMVAANPHVFAGK
jgi:hypothetical protein